MQLNLTPKLTVALRARDMLPYLTLLDVGASGGIPSHYRTFGDRLRAVGFDPLVSEVERLNRIETSPLIRYEAGWIGCNDYDRLSPPAARAAAKNNHPWLRLSSPRAMKAMSVNYAELVYNAGEPVRYTEDRFSLDEYAGKHGIHDVDMIKVDTEGHDLEVLLGASQTLETRSLLGAEVEVQFHGPEHEYSNVFHNIDYFMRVRGFSLFELNVFRYSRGVLPARFLYETPAVTESGQVIYGDALYLRDLDDPNHQALHGFTAGSDKLLKLCCLFEIFGLPDCAAELLLKIEGQGILDRELCRSLLDLLTPEGESYDDYVTRFDRDPTAFYPSAAR
jgi:FkbM family methyltransferase